jgi:NhaP-type Na+/H+ or K+/H+ antiporter
MPTPATGRPPGAHSWIDDGTLDIGRIAILVASCAVAYVAGEAMARLHVPRLPIYLAVGALAGLVISTARDAADVAFRGVSSVALGVIGFVAGSHLVWAMIRPQVRAILLQVSGMSIAVPSLGVGVVFMVLRDVDTPVKVATALLVGTVSSRCLLRRPSRSSLSPRRPVRLPDSCWAPPW